MKIYSTKDKKYIVVSIILLMLLWETASILVGNPIIVPSIKIVMVKLLYIVSDENFIKIIVSSIIRGVYSFLIALFIALLIGGISAFNKYIYNFILPIIAILRSVPTIAFIVLALIWMKKDIAPILIGVVIGFPIFYDIIYNSIINTDTRLLIMTDIYKVNMIKILKNIYLPGVFFEIIPSLASTFSLILKVVIAGELYGQPNYGIGAQINIEKLSLNTDAIIGWIIIVGVISATINLFIRLISKKIFLWKGMN